MKKHQQGKETTERVHGSHKQGMKRPKEGNKKGTKTSWKGNKEAANRPQTECDVEKIVEKQSDPICEETPRDVEGTNTMFTSRLPPSPNNLLSV